MGKKKKKREEERKPWCYYCDRTFGDETTLILHQKARHFRCTTCQKKMTTAPSLAIHCSHVHKTALTMVPNAKPGRDNVELEIFGMAGIPDDAFAEEPVAGEPAAKIPRLEPPVLPPPSLPPPLPVRPGAYGLPGMPAPMVAPRPMYSGPPPQYPGQHLMQQSMPMPGYSMPPYASAGLPTYMPGQPQPGFAPPAQPLFPIASTAGPAAAQPTGQAAAGAASTAQDNGTSEAQPVSDAKLLWTRTDVSMEEARAELPKYARNLRRGESETVPVA